MRKRFVLTDEQHSRLLEAGKPVMLITGSNGIPPPSPQERANLAWQMLGQELGFQWDTAQAIAGETDRVFEAEVA